MTVLVWPLSLIWFISVAADVVDSLLASFGAHDCSVVVVFKLTQVAAARVGTIDRSIYKQRHDTTQQAAVAR